MSAVPGDIPFNPAVTVSRSQTNARILKYADISTQTKRGLSIHTWPAGHTIDMEETMKFSELQGVDCLIEKYPLEKANEAYGKCVAVQIFLFDHC
jgi:D-arabinose 1-dehydrogenase-like Zn-dependent alcohol dehydrogenase